MSPTIKQKQAFKKTLENNGSVSRAMRDVGYSKNTAKNPKILTDSEGWKELMKQHLPDKLIAQKHKELLESNIVDHMVFPPFKEESKRKEVENDGENKGEQLTDDEIRDLFGEVNCKVRRIVHRELSRDVYFWSPDNNARKNALDMAYKLKGRYEAIKLGNPDGSPIQPTVVFIPKPLESDE